VVNSLRAQIDIPIQHVWQEDDGFQKCRVMNKAIVASRGEYLIFTDGDCIPHPDFDERMQYGGQDREFGERLINMGLQTRQVRYRCSCVHLDHGRGYARPESIAKNRAIRKRTRDNRITRTDFGIESAAQNDLAAR
jgi:glycosyltransferase involved in cell wall biosynthesis